MNGVYATIDLLGAVPGLFFAALIWRKGRLHPANRLLSVGLVAYSSILLGMFLSRQELVELSRPRNVLLNTLVHIAWPLFYLYLRSLTGQVASLSRRHLVHGGPVGLYSLVVVMPVLALPAAFDALYVASMILTSLVATGYSVAMLVVLLRYRQQVDEFFSEPTRLRITWITANVVVWFAVIGVQVGLFALQTLEVPLPKIAASIHGVFINLATVSWVYVTGYFAISHPDIFSLTQQMHGALAPSDAEPASVTEPAAAQVAAPQVPAVLETQAAPESRSVAPRQSADQAIVERVMQVMERDQPYLDEELTLARLAKLVGVPAYLLGRVINRELGKNFMTFVNEYRVRRACELLAQTDAQDGRIIDVAFQCGFRTKSAFNAFFKRDTGLTPSQYRSQQVPGAASVDS